MTMFGILLLLIIFSSCKKPCNDYLKSYVLVRSTEYVDYLITKYYPEHKQQYVDQNGEDEAILGYEMLDLFVEELNFGWTDVEIAMAVQLSVEYKNCPSIRSWDHFEQMMDMFLEICYPNLDFEDVEEILLDVFMADLVPGMTEEDILELKSPIECGADEIICDDSMIGAERLLEDFAIIDRCTFGLTDEEVREDVEALNDLYGNDLIPVADYALVADLGFEVTMGMTEYISVYSSDIPCSFVDLDDAVEEFQTYGMKCVVSEAAKSDEMEEWLNDLIAEACE